MPNYDYKCTECNHKFEMFQPMSAAPITNCPVCGGIVKRLIGAGAGPIFKGSGFYETDYKHNSTFNAKSNTSVPKSLSKEKKPTGDNATD